MTATRPVLLRNNWLPSALNVFFGPDPKGSDPWPGFVDAVAKFAELATAVRDEALDDLNTLGDSDPELARLKVSRQTSPAVEPPILDAPMRVVLMGRTMAGKSSLLAALTGAHHERIGNGRQRVTDDVFEAQLTASQHIEVVDTPGVGAYDGAEDFTMAISAARDADLILWVASSDSIQEETARALRLLGVIGKPILVVLNCRQSLAGVGKLNLLRFPERVFGNREGLVDEIRRHMAAAAVEPQDVIYVHALAATAALSSDPVDAELHAASRIDDLTNALLHEFRSHSRSRRVIRFVDSQRLAVDESARDLSQGAATLAATAERTRAMTADVHARLDRLVRSAEEALTADIETAVSRRRDWHLTVTDFGESLPSAWDAEVSALQAEIRTSGAHHLSVLSEALGEAIAGANAEWSTISPEQFAMSGLRGFNEVWGNRLLRAGVGLAGAGAAAWGGAQLGAAIGVASGPLAPFGVPLGMALGGLIGLGASFGLEPVKNLVGRVFLGKDGVLRKRREQVAERIGPVLDDLAAESSAAIAEHVGEVRRNLLVERAKSEARSAALDWTADRWTAHSDSLQSFIQELDRETACTLLRVQGRERLATSVRRATRVPGVCAMIEFEPTAFWEAWLFPPDIGERLVAGRPPLGGEAASALSYALGLVDGAARLTRVTSSSASVLVEAEVPSNISQAWADALTRHIGKLISIETARKASTT